MNNDFSPVTDPIVVKGGFICDCDQLESTGLAFRFQIRCADIAAFPGMNADPEDYLPAFVIQFGNSYYAYLNRCAHIAMELDWNPGEVFDTNHEYIVCATHYAVYQPNTGECLRGPCPKGSKLIALPITLKDGGIYLSL
jgi:nitrite reductase/ring-hydroxylating ferredoxin subunit